MLERMSEEKLRNHAIKHFENHVAKYNDYGDVQIIDWKNKSGNNECYIRYIFDNPSGTLTITGDLYWLVVQNGYAQSNISITNISQYFDDAQYFVEKVKASSGNNVYWYDETLAKTQIWIKLTQCYEDYDEDCDDMEISELCDELMEMFSSVNGFNGVYHTEAIEKLQNMDQDYFEWFYDCGKAISPNIYYYLEGLRMSMEQLGL
jgi:hypothetical protein